MSIEKIFLKSTNFVKKNRNLITTIGALVGLGTTIYFTAKATTKVESILKDKNDETEIKSQKKEVVKACVKPAVSTAITIACILLSFKYAKQTEAGLLAIIAGSEAMRRSYREAVLDSGIDPEEEAKIYEKSLVNPEYFDAKPLPPKDDYSNYKKYKESLTGEFIYLDPKDLLEAQIKLNRNINIKGDESFWFFLQCIDTNDTFKDYRDGAIRCGWTQGAEGTYGYSYVDICTQTIIDADNGDEYELIYYPFAPHCDYEEVDYESNRDYTVSRVLKSRCAI